MSRLAITLCGVLFLLFFLLFEGVKYVRNNLAMTAPRTEYYNLEGQHVRSLEDSVAGKKLVLTMTTDTNNIDDLIRRYKCIDVPSKAIVDTMVRAYYLSETNGKEEYFLVGKTGQISAIFEGIDSGIDSKVTHLAWTDLSVRKDTPAAYRVHTHVKEIIGQEDRRVIYPPSLGKDSDTDPRNFLGSTQAHVLLSYKEERVINISDPSIVGSTPLPDPPQTIYFYDTTGEIINMHFERFINIVKKINHPSKNHH